MTEYTDQLRDDLLRRIGELQPYEAELQRLRAAVERLDGARGYSRPRDLQSVSPEAAEALDNVRGVRQRQALALIAEHPGITAQQIADRLDLDTGILYAPVRRLVASGHVEKRGRGLHLVS